MKKITFLLVLWVANGFSQTPTQNYIKTTSYKVPTTTSIANPAVTQAAQQVTYFDGLGRTIQQVANQQSGSGKTLLPI